MTSLAKQMVPTFNTFLASTVVSFQISSRYTGLIETISLNYQSDGRKSTQMTLSSMPVFRFVCSALHSAIGTPTSSARVMTGDKDDETHAGASRSSCRPTGCCIGPPARSSHHALHIARCEKAASLHTRAPRGLPGLPDACPQRV